MSNMSVKILSQQKQRIKKVIKKQKTRKIHERAKLHRNSMFAAGMFRLTNKVFVSQPNVIYDVIRHGCRKIGGRQKFCLELFRALKNDRALRCKITKKNINGKVLDSKIEPTFRTGMYLDTNY